MIPNQNNPFQGKWKYRSYKNISKDPTNEEGKSDPGALLFGEGELTLNVVEPNALEGNLVGEGWELKIKGSINYGDPFSIRFQGIGIVRQHEWVYNYVGYLVSPWVNGVAQIPSIVGSVIRVKDHPGYDGTVHFAGEVASILAVEITGSN